MNAGAASSYIDEVASVAENAGEVTGRKLCLLLPEVSRSEGGVQKFNRCLVRAALELAERDPGLHVSILTLNDDPDEPSPYALRGSGDRIVHRRFRRAKGRIVWAGWNQAHDIDVLIATHFFISPAGWLMKLRNPRLRFYIVAHGIEAWYRLAFFQRLAAAAADGILTVSDYTRDVLRTNHGWNEDKFIHFPNTIDPGFEDAARRPLARPPGFPDGRVILTVCRLAVSERPKGVDTLIRAFPAILEREPAARLVVVGRGDDRKRLERLCRSLAVGGSVQFAGFVSDADLPAYYAHCDLFALPSRKEGFGIVFLEAMCFGKPCLGAQAGGTPEAIGEGGILVEADDPPALADAAVKLLRAPPAPAAIHRQLAPYRFPEFRKRLERLVYVD